MTAIVGGGIGAGYVAVRLFRQSRALLTTGKAEAGGGEGGNGKKKEFPMLDMAEVARRVVPRKKSFLYTRSGDKGTSQVKNSCFSCTNRLNTGDGNFATFFEIRYMLGWLQMLLCVSSFKPLVFRARAPLSCFESAEKRAKITFTYWNLSLSVVA